MTVKRIIGNFLVKEELFQDVKSELACIREEYKIREEVNNDDVILFLTENSGLTGSIVGNDELDTVDREELWEIYSRQLPPTKEMKLESQNIETNAYYNQLKFEHKVFIRHKSWILLLYISTLIATIYLFLPFLPSVKGSDYFGLGFFIIMIPPILTCCIQIINSFKSLKQIEKRRIKQIELQNEQ